MKSYLSNSYKLILFTQLREDLNGKCGSNCPNYYNGHNDYNRFNDYCRSNLICMLCNDNFNWLSCKIKYNKCPCDRKPNPEELFLRLDEYIEELEILARKEYSS